MGGEFDPAQPVGLTCGNHHSRVVGAVDDPGMGNGPLERASIGLDIFIFLRNIVGPNALPVCSQFGFATSLVFARFFPIFPQGIVGRANGQRLFEAGQVYYR